jgi:hypothetical protein
MAHRQRSARLAAEARDELIRTILAVVQRSYTTSGPSGPTYALAEFFRALDESTLRDIAYQLGVFEGDQEPEIEDRPPRGT